MTAGEAALASVLRRDRAVALTALLVICALAWAYLSWLAAGMSSMAGMDMPDMPEMAAPQFANWGAAHFLFIFVMWAVMMVGMMLPSVAPMILIHQRVGHSAAQAGRSFAPSFWFALGYLAVWTTFALAATAAQFGLERAALLSPMMEGASRAFGGAVLIAFGVYQWTPFKSACLSQCRAPLSFILTHGGFKADAAGSFRLGAVHGAYCVGCCWAIMALLFVVGVMNLLWVAALMIFVLAEKIAPAGNQIARASGALAIAVGLFELVA